ncbi:hypothetical protein MTO96_026817 [Rhipicephalus appendiculatus]
MGTGHVTSSTTMQQALKDTVGVWCHLEDRSCTQCPRADRHSNAAPHRRWATSPLSLSVAAEASSSATRPHASPADQDSMRRAADHGRTTEDNLSWTGVLFATTVLSHHPNGSGRSIAAPPKGRATYASAAERSSGRRHRHFRGTPPVTPQWILINWLCLGRFQITRRHREMVTCHRHPTISRAELVRSQRRCVTVHLGERTANRQRWLPCLFSKTWSGRSTGLLKSAPVVLEWCVPECGNHHRTCASSVSCMG